MRLGSSAMAWAVFSVMEAIFSEVYEAFAILFASFSRSSRLYAFWKR